MMTSDREFVCKIYKALIKLNTPQNKQSSSKGKNESNSNSNNEFDEEFQKEAPESEVWMVSAPSLPTSAQTVRSYQPSPGDRRAMILKSTLGAWAEILGKNKAKDKNRRHTDHRWHEKSPYETEKKIPESQKINA